jgi:hypothetical protein
LKVKGARPKQKKNPPGVIRLALLDQGDNPEFWL